MCRDRGSGARARRFCCWRGYRTAADRPGDPLRAHRWTALTRFLDNGRIDPDPDPAARSIPPIVAGHETALLAGRRAGARRSAIMASLVETAGLNGVEPSPGCVTCLTGWWRGILTMIWMSCFHGFIGQHGTTPELHRSIPCCLQDPASRTSASGRHDLCHRP